MFLKLFKNDKRNQLLDESVEALMMLKQAYLEEGYININEEIIVDYNLVREKLKERKKWISE